MNRRSFLSALLVSGTGAALGSTVDWDRLLWTPGQRSYFDIHRPEDVTTVRVLRGMDMRVGDVLLVGGEWMVVTSAPTKSRTGGYQVGCPYVTVRRGVIQPATVFGWMHGRA